MTSGFDYHDHRWLGYTHAEIVGLVNTGDAGAASRRAEGRWHATWFLIQYIEANLSGAIAEAGSGWEGTAATAMTAGVTPLGRWALTAAEQALATAKALSAQAEYADHLRRTMPPVAPLVDIDKPSTEGPSARCLPTSSPTGAGPSRPATTPRSGPTTSW